MSSYLKILGIDKDAVKINNPINFDNLYVFEAVNNNEEQKLLPLNVLEEIYTSSLMSSIPNNFLYLIITVDQDKEKRIKKVRIFYITFSENIKRFLEKISYLKQKKGENALLDIFYILSYEREAEFKNLDFIVNAPKVSLKDTFLINFPELSFDIYKNQIDNDLNIYISIPKELSYINIFHAINEIESGTLFLVFRFNDQTADIRNFKDYSKLDKEAYLYFKEIEEAYKAKKIKLASVSAMLFTKEKKVDAIFKALSLNYMKVNLSKYKFLALSPFKIFAHLYFSFFDLESLQKYFVISLYKNDENKTYPFIASFNKERLYTTFSFKEASAPHSFIVGKTGSGKSVFTQKTLLNLLGIYSLTKENALNLKLKENLKVRYFDVGQSAELLFKIFKLNASDKVEIIPPRLNQIVFNIFDDVYEGDEKEKEEKIEFAVSIFAFAYSLLTKENLNAKARALLKELILEFESKLMQRNVPLKKVKYLSSLYTELKKVGLKDFENIFTEKTYHIIKKYKNLMTVTLLDLYKLVKEKIDSLYTKEEEKKDYLKLLDAITIVKNNFPNMIFFSNFDINNKDFIYLELSNAKHYKVFPVFIVYLLKKLIRKDISFSNEYKLYFIEEAHTFFENKEAKDDFVLVFSYLAREARKYNVILFFISQLLTDIPENIRENIPNFFLVKARENDELVNDAKKILNIKGDALSLFEKCKKHECFIFSNSFTSFKYDLSSFELELFSKPQIQINDITLKKD